MSEIVFYPGTEARLARQKELEQLGEEITELAANIHAATYKLLVLIREFDERSGWSCGATVFFADSYASWQRGSNENANGRLRRFLARSTDLSKVSPQALRRIVERLNMQPHKCLGWKTPFEVHFDVSVALIM